MISNLLEQFLARECTPHVRQLLEEAIAEASELRPHFEFNRFEVTVERDEGVVLLEDVLDATEAGVLRVPLAEFVKALRKTA